ncbi:MAG: sulfurtransferase [Bacteroidota bacterium]|nr:sulfurtransferase [Bacteroidota bacterium]
MRPLISADELLQQTSSAMLPVILDCRYDLADTANGRVHYGQGHIPGAQYLSLDDDCCAAIGAHGGRHPLPSVAAMAALFSGCGVTRGETPVVAYDDEGGCFAARVWWMLRYLGHEDVRVLDGGFTAWKEAGGTVTREQPVPIPASFVPAVQEQMRVDAGEVSARDASTLLIDCRAHERFTGREEPIDPVAGHIPGAFNVPWKDLVEEDGRFRPVAALAEQLTAVDERSIMYCGSGVTACVNILAAEHCALGLPRLYAGSWSDWIARSDSPVATGE